MEDGSCRETTDRQIRDKVVRGPTVRVVTKGKPIRLSRPVQKLYPLEFRSEGEGIRALTERNRNTEIPTRRVLPRNAALHGLYMEIETNA